MQQIGDVELQQELGITNALHRLKLRLAVQEIMTVTTSTKSHRTVSVLLVCRPLNLEVPIIGGGV